MRGRSIKLRMVVDGRMIMGIPLFWKGRKVVRGGCKIPVSKKIEKLTLHLKKSHPYSFHFSLFLDTSLDKPFYCWGLAHIRTVVVPSPFCCLCKRLFYDEPVKQLNRSHPMSNYTRTNAAAGTHIEMHYVPAPFRTNSQHCYVVRITDIESGDTIYTRHFADHTAAYSYFLRSAEPPQSRRIDSPTFLPVIR